MANQLIYSVKIKVSIFENTLIVLISKTEQNEACRKKRKLNVAKRLNGIQSKWSNKIQNLIVFEYESPSFWSFFFFNFLFVLALLWCHFAYDPTELLFSSVWFYTQFFFSSYIQMLYVNQSRVYCSMGASAKSIWTN